MGLVDTHCHLQDAKFDADRGAVLARALDLLEWIVVVSDDLPASRAAVALAQPGVYAAAGIHPYHASTADADALDELRAILQAPQAIALGEIGLDYYNEYAPRTAQAAAFQKQLALAADAALPVIIHNRDADDDTYALLKEHAGALPGGIMHCFGSDAAFAERCVDLGFYISFAGNVAFPKAESLREVAASVPLERLLAETDAPYLAPPPKRGKRCEPCFVQYTAQVLAGCKGVSIEEFTEASTRNARAVYGL